GIGAADAQQQAVEGKLRTLHTLDDAFGTTRVERDDTDAEVEAPRLARREREGDQPIGLAGMIHPERRVAERLRFARTRADDLGGGGGKQGESVSHRVPPLHYDTRPHAHGGGGAPRRRWSADVVTQAILVRQLVEAYLQAGIETLL